MDNFDLSLEALQRYFGRNPKPKDFDSFWAEGLLEAGSIDLDISLKHSKFQAPFAECFDLYFTGTGGSRIYAKYMRPRQKTETQHPAILQFHGLGWHSSDWVEKLPYVSLGYSLLAMDCRGQGGYSEDIGGTSGPTLYGHLVTGLSDEPNKMLYRNIFLDTYLLSKVAKMMPEIDPDRIGVMGGSQGGGLAIACASLDPTIKKVAAMYPYLSDYKRVWEMGEDQLAYGCLRDYFRHFDPSHKREDEIFEKLGYIDIQNLSDRIKGDVLVATALSDHICPPSTQFAMYNKIVSNKEMILYHDYGHENLPYWHDHVYKHMIELENINASK